MTLNNRWAVLALVFFSRTSMAIQFFSLPPLLTIFIGEWGISYAQSGLLVSIAMFAGILLALPSGLLGQRFGDKAVFVTGLGLQALGAVLLSQADGFAVAITARALTGIGVVFLNVLATKIVTDWFAGKKLATAMSILVSSWPFGAAIALVSMSSLAALLGWRGAIAVLAGVSSFFLLAVLVFYRNLPPQAPTGLTRPPLWQISRPELGLILLAALVWALPNAGFVIFNAFTPALLQGSGMHPAKVGLVVSLISWVSIPCIPVGGLLADRSGWNNTLIITGVGVCALLTVGIAGGMVLWSGALGIGLAMGLWPGPIMSLPGQVLSPAARATGLGVFYTVFYLIATSAPPLAGWVRDQTESASMPLYFGAACFVATLLPLALLRLSLLRSDTEPAAQGG